MYIYIYMHYIRAYEYTSIHTVNTASDFRKNNAAAVVKKYTCVYVVCMCCRKNSLKCGSMLVFLFRLKFVSAAVMYK